MQMQAGVRTALASPSNFSRLVPARRLRLYQMQAADAIADSIAHPTKDGLSVMLFSRQAGKDEVLAQLVTFLLLRYSIKGGSIVLAAPTKDPQAIISYERTLGYALTHPFTRKRVRGKNGTITIGKAKAVFLSALGNARGQTASIALIANEAQDIPPDVWDAVFDPMAASTNAPTIFSGTIWTPDTLLSRQIRHADELTRDDGHTRVHRVDWHTVAKELPAYGDRVRARVAQLGANHPFIRTEYELIELNSGATMFNEQRLSMLQGAHPRQRMPLPGQHVAFLIDVAGADEAAHDATVDLDMVRTARDSTILTIVQVLHDSDLPTYRILDRLTWTNQPWVGIEGAISLLMDRWQPLATIIDATGIGHGMWQRIAATHHRRMIEPFIFGAKSKSDIGWQVIGMIDSGRLTEYAQDEAEDTGEHWWQLRHLTSTIRTGPSRLLTYEIPASVGHDDSVLSMMLVGHLDTIDIRPRTARGS